MVCGMSESPGERADSSSRATPKSNSESQKLHDEDWLQREYWQNGRTLSDIAEGCGCSLSNVGYWMDKHGIERREPGKPRADERLYDKEWYYKKYWIEGHSTTEIANICGCSPETAREWKRNHDIPTRTDYKSRGTGKDNPNWTDNTTVVECSYCGDEMEIRTSRVERSDNNFCDGVCQSRYVSENRRGEDHPLYDGGPTVDYGPNWGRQKRKALKRDQYRCQRCRKTPIELGQNPDVHHRRRIKWFKRKYDAPEWYEKGNALDNIISFCSSCHNQWEGIHLNPDVRG